MIAVRKTIYDAIKTATYPNGFPAVTVLADRPEKLESFPCITYRISDNFPQYGLDKSTGKQDTEVVLDIWSDTSLEGETILLAVETAMKGINYLLTFSSDVTDPSGGSHISTRFNY